MISLSLELVDSLRDLSAETFHQHLAPQGAGWIEVIVGSMFSGKTEELLRRIRRAMIAKQPTVLVKPKLDTRYAETYVVSHNQMKLPSIPVEKPEEILELAKDAWVVGIDEAQFFTSSIVEICEQLASAGKRVIVAGLDTDYRGLPFDPMPALMASAEYITKHLAICAQCGRPAHRNQRMISGDGQVLLGAQEAYEARCRQCFQKPSSL